MIALNEEQHLGGKAFIIFLLRRLFPVFIFILLIIVAIPARDAIINGLSTSVSAQLNSDTTISLVVTIFAIGLAALLFLAILFFILGFIIAILEYKTYSFTLEEFSLVMRQGILNRKEDSVPYRQIQDVNIERPLIYLVLGLSKIIFITAGHEEAGEHEQTEIVLAPIDKDRAEEIREKLEREIGVQVVEDEKKADEEADR